MASPPSRRFPEDTGWSHPTVLLYHLPITAYCAAPPRINWAVGPGLCAVRELSVPAARETADLPWQVDWILQTSQRRQKVAKVASPPTGHLVTPSRQPNPPHPSLQLQATYTDGCLGPRGSTVVYIATVSRMQAATLKGAHTNKNTRACPSSSIFYRPYGLTKFYACIQ